MTSLASLATSADTTVWLAPVSGMQLTSNPREHWPAGPSYRGISGVGRLDGVEKTPACEDTNCDLQTEEALSAKEVVVGGEELSLIHI